MFGNSDIFPTVKIYGHEELGISRIVGSLQAVGLADFGSYHAVQYILFFLCMTALYVAFKILV
jgi:hypothetical protein